MAKSLVEKYQQILENDPGSLVFIELAKALLDRGDAAEAGEVCLRGLEHHPDSVVGRVLLGKALLCSGHPAEAMDQFDKATSVERDNPYAYNLIGEVLVQKGLFRSALPILKKAIALQPNDGRVRSWLEQAQKALGLPVSLPPLTAPAEGSGADQPATPSPASSSSGLGDVFRALGSQDAAPPADPSPAEGESPPALEGTTDLPESAEHAASASSDRADSEPAHASSAETAGSQPVAARREEAARAAPPILHREAAAAPSGDGPEGLLPDLPPEPSDAGAGAGAGAGSLLPDLGAPEEEAAKPPPTPAPAASRPAPAEGSIQISADLFAPPPLPPAPPPVKRSGLLADLPEDFPSAPAPAAPPAPSVAPERAEDIAREYEKELRARLLATGPVSFWRRHWLGLGVAAALVIALVAGAAIYQGTRHQNRGRDLIELRTKAFRALALETPTAYRDAIELADQVLSIAPDDLDARAATALANAVLYARFGGEPGRKAAAEKELPAIRERYPGFALAIALHVASGSAAVEKAKSPVLVAAPEKSPKGFEGAEIFSLAGRLLMSQDKPEAALAKFKLATDLFPNHVGTLTALGDYYQSQSDWEQALRFYTVAKGVSPDHVPALLGAVAAQLSLGEGETFAADLQQAKAAFQTAQATGAPWPAGLRAELDLLEGRTLAAQGKVSEAVAALSSGATEHKSRAADFYAALGAVEADHGNFDRAEAAFGRALEKRPRDVAMREALARALIAQGRYAEAIRRTEGAGADDRRLRIVRGLARLEMGQPGKAREELNATRRNGRVPPEAAIYLATLDASQGQRELALSVLESAAKASKSRAPAHVALGRLYLEDGKLEEARAQFTLAAADPRHWEGNCSLGRLLLRDGKFPEAKKQLETAIARNHFHAEARIALGEALLALGDADRAQSELAAALKLSPSAAAQRGMARVLLARGDLVGARKSAQAALRLDAKNPETTRLSAQIALAAGDAQEAIRSLERAAKANPADPSAVCELGELQVKVGNQPAARKAFEAALKADSTDLRARLGIVAASLPKAAKQAQRDSDALVKETAEASPALKARALGLNARVYLALGNTRRAQDRAQAAVKADDSSADAHLALALVAKAIKNADLALGELQRTVGLDPTLAEAHLALADSLARDPKELPRAIAEIEAYLRIAPNGPDAASAKKYLALLKKRDGGR